MRFSERTARKGKTPHQSDTIQKMFSRRYFVHLCSFMAAAFLFPYKRLLASTDSLKPAELDGLNEVRRKDVKFSVTRSVLMAALHGEMMAHYHYEAFALKAGQDNFANIGYLFTALSVSEFTHAQKFKVALSELGEEAGEIKRPDIYVSSTKENLRGAAQNEIEKIDVVYPEFVEKISEENWEPAIRYCYFAWESHKQHRDHLERILRWGGLFFGMVARKFEKNPVRYFVCEECGSTVIKIPEETCHICNLPVTLYKEVARMQ